MGLGASPRSPHDDLVFGERPCPHATSRTPPRGGTHQAKHHGRLTIFPDTSPYSRRRRKLLAEKTRAENRRIDQMLKPCRTALERIADVYDPPDFEDSEEEQWAENHDQQPDAADVRDVGEADEDGEEGSSSEDEEEEEEEEQAAAP